MEMHARMRLEITVEKRRLLTVLDLLDAEGDVTGCTAPLSLGGRGHTGAHLPQPYSDRARHRRGRRDRQAGGHLVETRAPLIDRIVGIVAISDVQVMRAAHF